ncbi:MAG: ATP-binding protein [Acidimicrobiales bacterium]
MAHSRLVGAEVRLSVMAVSESLRLCRLVAAGLGGEIDLDLDEVEELRVAVDELCALLVEGDPGGRLELTLRPSRDCIEVEAVVAGGDGGERLSPVAVHGLVLTILKATVDDHQLVADEGRRWFRLSKSRRARP